MEMVAAAKFNRAQGDVRTLRPFAEATERLLENYLRSGTPGHHPLLARETVERRALVVVSSDRGLCGAYNSHVLKAAVDELEREETESVGVIPAGRKAADFFRLRRWEVLVSARHLGDRLDAGRARELARQLADLYSTGRVDQVDVVYTRFVTTLKREIVVRPLLGIRLERAEETGGVPYILEPTAEGLLADLLPRVLITRVTALMAETFASEHSARMVAMRSATDNAAELIDQLTLIRNRMRQTAITKELADIVGAAEAMR